MNLRLELITCLLLLCLLLLNCFDGGTHGSIKAYQYPVSKYYLDSAVQKAFKLNPKIHQDTTKDYYNDLHTYVTIEIEQPGGEYEYIFRYGGDSTYWDTSHHLSDLFICYAYDPDNKGGSEGDGGVTERNKTLKRKLTKPFETEFISKLDSILQIKSTNPD